MHKLNRILWKYVVGFLVFWNPIFHVLLHQFCDLPSLLSWLWLLLFHNIQVISGFKILYKVLNENMEMNLFMLTII